MSSLFGIAAGGSSEFYGFNINQSLRFTEGEETYLRKTNFSGSPTSEQTGTFSVWVKNTMGFTNNRNAIYGSSTGSAAFTSLALSGDTQGLDLRRRNTNSSDIIDVIGNPAQRDPSAWYHIMSVYDMTNSTRNDRAQIYVNGVRVTDLGTNTLPNNTTTEYYSGDFISDMQIGRTNTNSSNMLYADFILAEYHRVDGQALSPTSFGEFKSGVWVPKEYTGTYGNHGFHLDFADTSDIGKDVSGNSNDFTPNNFVAADVIPDSPTLNYATMNKIDGPLFSTAFGNLRVNGSSSSAGSIGSTFFPTTGKWYVEMVAEDMGNGMSVGIKSDNEGTFWKPTRGKSVIYQSDGNKIIDGGSASSYGATYTVGDIISLKINLDDGIIEFLKNNSSQGNASTALTSGVAFGVFFLDTSSVQNARSQFNFGQDSSFRNTVTSGSADASDANGHGDFYYSVPSGYLALNSANLPETDITPLNDDIPEDYFNTVLYDGASAIVNVTGVGFSPDFLWLKRRNASSTNHKLLDTVRGSGQALESNNTGSESDESANFSSFDSDGFTLPNVGAGAYNVNGGTFVSWNWLAGTAFSNDASATSVGTIDSSGQVNTKAGFSIISYTGAGSTETVAHGLLSAPELVLHKNRTDAADWEFITTVIDGSVDFLRFTTAGKGDSSRTAPTSTVFEIGSSANQGASGKNYIAYCFHSVDGYSKFASYTGNGSTGGTFVYTGFRPAFVIIKQTSASGNNWNVHDNKRGSPNEADPTIKNNNVVDARLLPSSGNQETTFTSLDFVSNGFKLRNDGSSYNGSGSTYIYMAFAEMPFKYANAR